MYIDSHAHIYSDEFKADREHVMENSLDAGVKNIYMPNVDHNSIEPMLEAEQKYKGICIPMMGLHPCNVKKHFEKDLYEVEDWLRRRKFAAVGEIGIDLYWDTSLQAEQEEAFKIQVDFAKQYSLPIVIHCRNSFRETMKLLKEVKGENQKGVFHCFSGTKEEAQEVVDIGFCIGIGGVVTFKNGGLDKVLPHVALEHIILETDCPYLAPVPFRGKRNEPSYIPLIAEKIASIKNIKTEEVAAATTKNTLQLFADV